MYPVIVIPSYQPDLKLISLIKSLSIHNHLKIIVVNDGSSSHCQPVFTALKSFSQVTIIEHAVNLGKGQALKTAFNYFLTHFTHEYPGVITADADGQHSPEDIFKLVNALKQSPHTLYLGSRAFDTEVPWKSRFGNDLTKFIFKHVVGQSLQDTQTGLRAIPRSFLKPLLRINSNGYEFELDMLIKATKEKLPIKEIIIQTIYNNKNKGSHFNPIVDSFKIYFVFLRFLIFSIISGLIDFLAFALAFFFCQNILLSESLARLFSGTCNFLFNKEWVFKSKANLSYEALKYSLLCAINLVFSYALIQSLIYFGVNIYLSKLIALFGLFIANFSIQKLLVFNQKGNPKEIKIS